MTTAYNLYRVGQHGGKGWRVYLPGYGKVAHVERSTEDGDWVGWCMVDLATTGHGRTRHDAADLAIQHYLIEHR